jgi:molybdenum cofactor biosynthesis enzyme MoaA
MSGELFPTAGTGLQPLSDRFGRSIDYLRVSVTDRCDLRCTYCMPSDFKGYEDPPDWLSFDEIERVVAAFARLGTSRVRLTGGEPLTRRGVTQLAGRLSACRACATCRCPPMARGWRATPTSCMRPA